MVVSFVTFEKEPPSQPPTVTWGASESKLTTVVKGVTHVHVTSTGDRTYFMHFVRLERLAEKQRVFYSVKSGAAGAPSSPVFSFRAGYRTGVTNINIYGKRPRRPTHNPTHHTPVIHPATAMNAAPVVCSAR